ncbi:MAG TPA: cytochrome o ubiquinol oxidase subunit IV [Alphaproteobacteria bacterium]|jgi:cytochrome o ubiquinol oxidase operon protein cyoD|nr:cytochrome o ubiquinol oxidase subunit IV [Alphaproteobacteria bacterium]
MTEETHAHHHEYGHDGYDSAPGDQNAIDVVAGTEGYLLGMVLAVALTAASFWAAQTDLIYAPGIPIALGVFAVAQMGVHLVFFLHISTGPDNTNNILALAFGILIVVLVVAGSLWIVANLNHNMVPMDQLMKMQR